MGFLLSVYSLFAITQTNSSRSAYNITLQHLKYSDHNDDNNITIKTIYIEDLVQNAGR